MVMVWAVNTCTIQPFVFIFFYSTFWRNTSPLDLNCSLRSSWCLCCTIHAVILSMTHFKCTLFSMAFLCTYIISIANHCFCHKRVCSHIQWRLWSGLCCIFLYHIVCFMCSTQNLPSNNKMCLLLNHPVNVSNRQ